MDAMLTVPGNLVSYLRSGLFGVLGCTAEDIANITLESGSNSPEGAYDEPLQAFDVLRVHLDAVGWRNTASRGDVAINLSLGGVLVVKALKRELDVLGNELQELPKKITSREVFDIALERVEALGEFVKLLETRVKQYNSHQTRFLAGSSTSIPSLPPRQKPPRARRRPRQ